LWDLGTPARREGGYFIAAVAATVGIVADSSGEINGQHCISLLRAAQ